MSATPWRTQTSRPAAQSREQSSSRARFDVADLAPSAVEIADDVTHVLLGRDGLDVHDGLQHDRARLAAASLKAKLPAILNAISELSTSW